MSVECVDSVIAGLEVNQWITLLVMGYCNIGFSIYLFVVFVFVVLVVRWAVGRKNAHRLVEKIIQRYK